MAHAFRGDCRPVLIGSMPLTDHEEAHRLVKATTAEVPVWVQLPRLAGEGMVAQFLAGMPGIKQEADRYYIDSTGEAFDNALLAFYERYLSLESGAMDAHAAGFGLDPGVAGGFGAVSLPPAATDPGRMDRRSALPGPVRAGGATPGLLAGQSDGTLAPGVSLSLHVPAGDLPGPHWSSRLGVEAKTVMEGS